MLTRTILFILLTGLVNQSAFAQTDTLINKLAGDTLDLKRKVTPFSRSGLVSPRYQNGYDIGDSVHTKEYPRWIFKDTICNLALESRDYIFDKDCRSSVMQVTRYFKYLGDTPVVITSTNTSDPHFICDYPRLPLEKNKLYSYTICFTFTNNPYPFTTHMSFWLSTGQELTFVVSGKPASKVSGRCCNLDTYVYDSTIYSCIQYAFLDKLKKTDFLEDQLLLFRLSSVMSGTGRNQAITGGQKNKQQFYLRAFLNTCKLATNDEPLRLELAFIARNYIEQETVAFACCFDNSNCLQESDLKTFASLVAEHVLFSPAHNPDGSNMSIEQYVQHILFRAGQSSPEIKKVLATFTGLLSSACKKR